MVGPWESTVLISTCEVVFCCSPCQVVHLQVLRCCNCLFLKRRVDPQHWQQPGLVRFFWGVKQEYTLALSLSLPLPFLSLPPSFLPPSLPLLLPSPPPPPPSVDPGVWQQVVKLYPALVQCVTCSSVEVRTALKEALAQFSDLILTVNQ